MYYSVVGLKICTIHCNVISVGTVGLLFFSRYFTPCRHFWSVMFMSCIFSLTCTGMQAVNLSVSELQMYGTVKWLNASDALGKIKKGVDILTVVFIFKSAVVLLAHERIKTKKKSKVYWLAHNTESFFVSDVKYFSIRIKIGYWHRTVVCPSVCLSVCL